MFNENTDAHTARGHNGTGGPIDDVLLTFLDVETPNQRNDRICSIALVQTDLSGTVVNEQSMLINPESAFSDVNMHIHGIAPVDVLDKMTFPEAWNDVIYPMVNGTLLVAHNATFDLCVLSKALIGYGIDRREVGYACTKRMAEMVHPEFQNYKLPFVCEKLGLQIGHHHNAESDAKACEEIFWALISEVRNPESVFSTYWFEPRQDTPRASAEKHVSKKTEDMRYLMSHIEVVLQDGNISTAEAMELLEVITESEELRSDATVSNVLRIIQTAAADGEIDRDESTMLRCELGCLLDPTTRADEQQAIAFDGCKFCLSGNFEHGTKDDVAKLIGSRGGEIMGSVTKKCDYVVVGGCGSEAWALGNYGTKVKKALDMQSKGSPIKIVSEETLYRQVP